jgi:hypothetical protein
LETIITRSVSNFHLCFANFLAFSLLEGLTGLRQAGGVVVAPLLSLLEVVDVGHRKWLLVGVSLVSRPLKSLLTLLVGRIWLVELILLSSLALQSLLTLHSLLTLKPLLANLPLKSMLTLGPWLTLVAHKALLTLSSWLALLILLAKSLLTLI